MCRDFTVNALYYDPATNEVLDFVGGVADTQARTLRLTKVCAPTGKSTAEVTTVVVVDCCDLSEICRVLFQQCANVWTSHSRQGVRVLRHGAGGGMFMLGRVRS